MPVLNEKTRGDTTIIIARALFGNMFHPKQETPAATSGSTTTLVDTKYSASIYEDDHFNNWEIGVYNKWITLVTDFTKSSGTWTFALQASAPAANDKYWVINPAGWSTAQIYNAIDLAIEDAGRHSALTDKVSYALAAQLNRSLYVIPSGFTFVNGLYIDSRNNYLARHPSGRWDTLTTLKTAATTRVKLAQSFKVAETNPSVQLFDVYLLLAKAGSPTGNLTVTIEGSSSSLPDGTAIATSATVAASTITTEPTYIRFTFTNRPLLDDNVEYWITITTSAAASATDYIIWANDSVEADYGDGSAAQNNDTSWSALAGDFIFTVRGVYPRLVPLRPQIHYTIVRDSTRYLRLTPAGLDWLQMNGHDGAAFHLEGQGAPALPANDASTLEVPYGYAVAHAALQLVASNPGWWSRMPGAMTLPRYWEKQLAEFYRSMRTGPRPGSMQVEPY